MKRIRDPKDRRKVVIQPLPDRIPEIGQLYASLGQDINRLRSRYGDEEQALLLDFSTRVNRTFEEETPKLRGDR